MTNCTCSVYDNTQPAFHLGPRTPERRALEERSQSPPMAWASYGRRLPTLFSSLRAPLLSPLLLASLPPPLSLSLPTKRRMASTMPRLALPSTSLQTAEQPLLWRLEPLALPPGLSESLSTPKLPVTFGFLPTKACSTQQTAGLLSLPSLVSLRPGVLLSVRPRQLEGTPLCMLRPTLAMVLDTSGQTTRAPTGSRSTTRNSDSAMQAPMSLLPIGKSMDGEWGRQRVRLDLTLFIKRLYRHQRKGYLLWCCGRTRTSHQHHHFVH